MASFVPNSGRGPDNGRDQTLAVNFASTHAIPTDAAQLVAQWQDWIGVTDVFGMGFYVQRVWVAAK